MKYIVLFFAAIALAMLLSGLMPNKIAESICLLGRRGKKRAGGSLRVFKFMLCSGILFISALIYSLIEGHHTAILFFALSALVCSAELWRIYACSILYSESDTDGFDRTDLLLSRTRFRYEDIKEASKKGGYARLYFKNGKRVSFCTSDRDGSELLAFAEAKYYEMRGEKLAYKEGDFSFLKSFPYLRSPLKAFIAFPLALVLLISAAAISAIIGRPYSESRLINQRKVFSGYTEDEGMLFLTELGEEAHTYVIYRYQETLENTAEFLASLGEETEFSVILYPLNGDRWEGYYSVCAVYGPEGEKYLELDTAMEARGRPYFALSMGFTALSLIWILYSALFFYLSRHGDRLPRSARIITLGAVDPRKSSDDGAADLKL